MSSSDILRSLGPIALGSRLKRLAERLQADAMVVIERAGLPIQPSQVGVLAALDQAGVLSVGDAVARVGLSQPAVTRIVAGLQELGLVDTSPDPHDARTRRIAITAAGRDVVATLRERVWPQIARAVGQLSDGRDGELLAMIADIEFRLGEKSMADRVRDDITILPFAPERAKAFHDINAAWIEDMFVLEPHDRDVLENPQREIIDRGGVILFAMTSDLGIVGTCALMPVGDGGVELTKMGVLAAARGRKIGEALLAAVLEQAAAMRCDPLFLLTNKKCGPAIHLYEKLGFQHDAEIMARYGASYERCDVAMRFVGVSGGR